MAAEVLLELLYYNGTGECLTFEQTDMMNVCCNILLYLESIFFLRKIYIYIYNYFNLEN